jgi:hypothetical protein
MQLPPSPLRRFVPIFLAALAFPLLALAADATKAQLPPKESDFADEQAALAAILDYHERVGRLDGLEYGLPRDDFDDVTNLTLRQRRAFRQLYPESRTEGIYQYPRWAFALMRKLDDERKLVVGGEIVDGSALVPMIFPGGIATPLSVVIGADIDVSNNTQVESETYIAINPTDDRNVVGGSNNITNDPQMIFTSTDAGTTWRTGLLPIVCTFHSDPWIGFDSNGVAYSSALEYSTGCAGKTRLNLFRSTDKGISWSAAYTVNATKDNDKQLNAVDAQPSSPCRDRHYMGWDDGSAEMVGAAPAWDGPWTIKSSIDSYSIGTDLAVGPAGEVYSVWAKTTGQIRFAKSTDCGATWSTAATIASTVDGYDYGIPAQCARRILIYPSVDVDRSNGPRRGWVYAAWNDFTAVNSSGCVLATDPNTANVWFSRSTDGGTTWSAKKILHEDDTALPKVDQFNQWMRVDDADGTIHAAWYDTRSDAARVKSEIYYSRSFDGGTTFETPVKVSDAQSSESGGDGNQYGDYAGLAVRNGVAWPFWTDRRAAWGNDEETATARICSDPKEVGPTSAVDADSCASSGIGVTWSLPSVFWGDGGFGIRKFQLWRDGVLVQDGISPTATGLTHSPGNSLPHTFAIKAVNGCGNVSTFATSASVADLADSSAPSAVPANSFRIVPNGAAALLTWSPSPSPDVASYRLRSSSASSGSFPGGWTLVASPASPASSQPIGGPTLFYLVTAVDGCGNESGL